MAKLQTKTLTATAAKSHHKFTLTVNENTTDIANNQSPMDFTFKLSPVQSGWDWSGWGSSISYSINIGGNIYSGTIPSYDGSSTVTLKTGSLNIKHDEDGTKKIHIAFSVNDSTGQSYTPGNASASSTMELTTIPRASSISVSNYDLGQNPNIVIGKKVSSFTSTLSYKIGERTGILIEKTSDSSYVWEMTEELINQIKTDNPNNKTVSAIVYCDTFDGDTQIGSQTSTTFILTITDKPVVVDVVRAELNSNVSALTDKVLRSISQNQFTITANAPTGTTIKSYKVTNDIQSSGDVTSNVVTLNDIQNSYTSDGVLKTKFLITCTDERGNVSEEYPIELDFINYINVSINKTDIKVTRTNSTTSDAILNLTGNFYNGLIGDTQNEIVLKCKYRIKGEAEYTDLPDLTPTYIENQFKIENIKLEGTYDYQEVHEFLFYAIDSTQVQDDGEFVFASSIAIALWHKNGAYIKEIDTDLLKINNRKFVFEKKLRVGYKASLSIKAGEYTKVPFDCLLDEIDLETTEDLELTEDGGIKIIADEIKLALINARIRFSISGNTILAIRKNDETVNMAVHGQNVVAYTHNSISALIDAEKNDIIYIYAYSEVANTILGGGNPSIWVAMDVLAI